MIGLGCEGSILASAVTRSRSSCDLSPDLLAALGDVIGERTAGRVWVAKSGRPCDPAYLTHRFQKSPAAAGLPVIPLPYLRHYYVSCLPQLDVHMAVAQKLARHASAGTTMSIYTSVEEGLKRQAFGKLDAALHGLTTTVGVPVDVPAARLQELSQAPA